MAHTSSRNVVARLQRRLPLRAALALALACLFAAAHAIEITEEYGWGGEVSQNEACRRAQERAKTRAISRVLGEVMSVEEQMLCRSTGGKSDDSCEFNQMSWSVIEGEIREVKEIARKSAVPRGPDNWACVVTLDVDVVVPTRKPDPRFQVSADMFFLVPGTRSDARQRDRVQRTNFHPGDEFVLEVKSTEPAHLALFGWLPSEDNRVYRIDSPGLRPNCPQANLQSADKGRTEELYCLSASWSDAYKDAKKPYYEWLILVASKTPQPWLPAYEIDQFKATLREIPQDQRRVVRRGYQLMK